VLRQGALHRLDGSLDARAVAARRREQHATTGSRHAVMVAPGEVT